MSMLVAQPTSPGWTQEGGPHRHRTPLRPKWTGNSEDAEYGLQRAIGLVAELLVSRGGAQLEKSDSWGEDRDPVAWV